MFRLKNALFAIIAIVVVFTSCQPSKKVHEARLYLQGIDSSVATQVMPPEPVVQKGELLSITVFSDDADASAPFNQQQTNAGIVNSSTDGSNTGQGKGYLVDAQGNFNFQGLGLIHAAGLTKMQLKSYLEQKLDTFLKHPYVDIRFLNKRVTILGEVAKPGVINIPEDRLTILDAIALSGDITNFGRRDNILIVREENGKRSTGRIDVKRPDIYKSAFFYLQAGDMVYIEPVRMKPTGNDATLLRNISLAATFVSVLALLYSVLRNN